MKPMRLFILICCAAALPSCIPAQTPPITFLGRTYHVGSFSATPRAMWELVSGGETVDNWTTLLTLIDRPDAHTPSELDRLAEGIQANYQSHGAKIISAKTLRDPKGAAYNYMVVAFDQPALHRYELDFVKLALAPKNAYVAVYGARITDPKDYVSKSKAFLTQRSGEIGRALEALPLPDLTTLPRKAR